MRMYYLCHERGSYNLSLSLFHVDILKYAVKDKNNKVSFLNCCQR